MHVEGQVRVPPLGPRRASLPLLDGPGEDEAALKTQATRLRRETPGRYKEVNVTHGRAHRHVAQPFCPWLLPAPRHAALTQGGYSTFINQNSSLQFLHTHYNPAPSPCPAGPA